MKYVEVFPNSGSLYQTVAARIVGQARDAVERRGRFTMVLAGGSTPRRLYSLLANDFREVFPWADSHFFWGDERHVPPDHPDSNFRMAWEAMLSLVPVPASNLHRIRAEEADPHCAADQCGTEIREFFQLADHEFPRFDLVLLGLGPDGHTASLFPSTEALHVHDRLAAANWVPKLNAFRITMTLPVFNHSACVDFVVQGEDKAEALHAILEGERQPDRYPAQAIQPADGDLYWSVDAPAAGLCHR